MRIIMENGSYHLLNMGDLAMIQTAVKRLSALWPDARIDVITRAPEILHQYCPHAVPLSPHGRKAWINSRGTIGRFHPSLAGKVSSLISEAGKRISKLHPGIGKNFGSKLQLKGNVLKEMNAFVDLIEQADLIVASGGGYINDAFQEHAMDIMQIIDHCGMRSKTTALLGLGLGPISSQPLLKKVGETLPWVDLIALREKKKGLGLLLGLNVSPDRIAVTGDDGIEPAWNARKEIIGKGIGVNVRLADYAETGVAALEKIRVQIHAAAGRYRAPLVSLPISFVKGESDVQTITRIMEGSPSFVSPAHPSGLNELLENVSLCRIAITGSYHGAVFALAQGIPAICLVQSQYYRDKFGGLADQFGKGLQIIELEDNEFEFRFHHALDKAWHSAEQMRPSLLESARQQIQSGYETYQKLKDIVESKKRAACL